MKEHKALIWRLLSALVALTILVPATVFVAPVPGVRAADTGWYSPGNNWADDTAGDLNGFELDPAGAYAIYESDGRFAGNQDGAGDRHHYYYFGFDSVIPADADIVGIEVRLDGWVTDLSGGSSAWYDVDLSWDGGSSWSAARSTPSLQQGLTTLPFYIVGGQSELWGHVWSASELSNTNLRVRITSRASGAGSGSIDFLLDWVTVRVTYRSAYIRGTVWQDDNANGVQDGAEVGLSNVHVSVYQDDGDGVFEGGSDDVEVGSDDTDVDGTYDTGPFMDGYSYWVDVDTPANHYLTTPPEPRLVSLPDGNSVTFNFGYAPFNPSIEIAKTPDTQTVVSGSTAAFTIAVTNTGDITLTNVTISDALAPDCDAGLGTLGVGEGDSYECTLANVTGDFTNSAMVTGTDTVLVTEVSDTDTADVDVIAPAIAIVKTPGDQVVASGSTVDFTIAVTNTGDVSLDSVTVSDAQAPDCDAILGTLGVGASMDYGCSLDNVTDGFINSAVVTGQPATGDDVAGADAANVRLDETQTCPADILAYLRLDETSGATYDDFYYGHDGECTGQCPAPTVGRVNGGQAFNGSSTGIDLPAIPGDDLFNWGGQDSFSIEFWMRANSATSCSHNNEVIVGRDDRPNSELHWWVGIGCWVDGKAAFVLRDTGGDIHEVIGTTDLTDGSWYHIVAVKDTSAGEISIYVNGLAEDSASASYSAAFDSSTAGVNIGWLDLYGSQGYHFDGVVDEVAIYDRALSSSAIRQHHNEGLAGRWYCQTGTFTPIIVSSPVTNAVVGRTYVYDVEAAGSPISTYTLSIMPHGMTIDTATGLISWTPTIAQEGDHDVEVVARNSEGTDTQSFTISVAEGTLCPGGMIAYWKLDEVSGATYYDFYDGHDGVCAGDCPTSTTGYINGGQEFGNTTGIDVPADEAFGWGLSDSFSIEYWMRRPGTPTGNEVVIGRQGLTHPQPHWWTGVGEWTGNVAAFCLYDTDGVGDCIAGTTAITDGVWHHVVAVRDVDANRLRIYVDGEQEGALEQPLYSAGFDTSTALNIGWLNLSQGYHFHGVVDEIAIYDRAMSPDEIRQHHDESGPGYCINPDIGLDKTASSPVVYLLDTVIYSYTVTNPGDDPLSSLNLSDDKCTATAFAGGDDDADDKLDPSEMWVYTCSMTLSSDTVNTATVTGTFSLSGIITATDIMFVDVITPEIALDKVVNPTMIYADDTVIYTYTVTNPGDDPLSDLSLRDDRCSPVSFVGGDSNLRYELDPGENWTYTCTMVASVDITNTATVTGTDSAGGTVSVTDTAFVDVINPNIEIAKTPDGQTVRYNSTVTFTIVITNTGDATLTDVTVADALAPDCSRSVGSLPDLAVTESTSYLCTLANATADFTNSATVTGTPPIGPAVSDADTAFVDVINPNIEIAKTPDSQTVRYGSTVTFTIAITNTGDTTLTDITVSDPLAPDCSRLVGSLSDLAATESTSYTCTVANATADFTNSATATGKPPVGSEVIDFDTAVVDVISPSIEIAKTPDSQMVLYGSTVIFAIAITNTGDATLTDVTVSDPLAPNCSRAIGSLSDLAATESTSYICTLANATADFTNSATVTGNPPVGSDITDFDTAVVDVINPSVEIAKTSNSQMVLYGATVTFTIAITNTGDATLTDMTVADALAPDCSRSTGSLSDLGAMESTSYTCVLANATLSLLNSATVTGRPPVGSDISDTDTAFVDVITPYIAVAKTPDSQTVLYGSTVTFTITVTNTSDAALTDVTVLDTLAPNCSRSVGSLPDLAATESTSYTCTLTGVTAEFTNIAIVTGTPSIGPDVSDADIAFIGVISPSVEIAKTPDSQAVQYGSIVTFTITVTNTGDATLTDVTVQDVLAPDCSRSAGNLPDLAATESTSYLCTLANVVADFTNSATVTSTPPVGPAVSDADTAFVNVIAPAIEIAKTPDSQTVGHNSTVTFTIAITNTGDVTLMDVTVSDPVAPDCDRIIGSLPDLVAMGSTSYTCSLANVTADFTNSAMVTATPPVGNVVTYADVAFVDVEELHQTYLPIVLKE